MIVIFMLVLVFIFWFALFEIIPTHHVQAQREDFGSHYEVQGGSSDVRD